MKKLFGLLLFSNVVLSQSVPNGTIVQGQVWTPAQWNAAWQSKSDFPLVAVGSDTQVQFNLAGGLAGSSNFTWDNVNRVLSAPIFSLSNTNLDMTGAYAPATSALYTSGLFIHGVPTTPPNGLISPFNIYISGDTVDADTNGNGFLTGLSVLDAPGAGFKGGRTGIQGSVSVVGTPAVIDSDGIVGVLGIVRASANMLGAAGSYASYAGSVFGGNSNIFTTTGATFLKTVNAHEFDSTIASGTSAADHYGISIVEGSSHAVQGAFDDSAISINNQGGASVGWNFGISFGSYAHQWAFGNTSTLIGAQIRQVPSVGTDPALYGVDFRNVSFQSGGAAFISTGWSIDPSGSEQANSVVIGSPAGGNKGAGTFNANAGFIGGVAVSTSTGANPTGTIGLTAVNGSATTFMRSDAAPIWSQALSPTNTGSWTFAGFSNVSTSTTAVSPGTAGAGAPSLFWVSSTGATDSKLWFVGATATDFIGRTVNDANSANATWLDVNRSGNTIVSVAFGNAVTNPGYFFNGTGAISGVGSGLTLLNASNISSGTVNAARLPASSVTLAGTSGSIGGGALIAGQCTSGTATVAGATTSMVALADPNTYPGDGTIWDAQVTSSNTVTTKVCAIIALTPTSSTYNIRVLQ
jgi:hypothetical protein